MLGHDTMSINNKNLPKKPGVYLLVLEVKQDIEVYTRRKKFYVPRGVYVYVGSAKGSGGLYARVKRHLSNVKRLFWHIDYLLENNNVAVKRVFYKVIEDNGKDYESLLARCLVEKLKPIPNFGCSDKPGDYSHLFKCGRDLEECINRLQDILDIDLKTLRIR